MRTISSLHLRLPFIVIFSALLLHAQGWSTEEDEDTDLGWTPFMTRGEILRRNRWLSYTIRGRFHSPTDPWVYDCRVVDMDTNTAVAIRHFYTKSVALNMTVDLLFKKLESKGVLPKETKNDDKTVPDQPLNLEPTGGPKMEDVEKHDQEENGVLAGKIVMEGTEGTPPHSVILSGSDEAIQVHGDVLAFDAQAEIGRDMSLHREGNVNPGWIILMTSVSILLTSVVFGMFCKLYCNSKRASLLQGNIHEPTDIPLEENVVPDSDGSYKHLSVQEARPTESQLDPSENYVLFESRDKGLVYILNNNSFRLRAPKQRHRRGSEVDVSNVRHVFTEIGYEPVVYQNLSAEETLTSLDKLVLRINKEGSRHSSVVLIFMSHGDRRGILGNDENVITVREITDRLSGRRCPMLVGKPKIMFFQACRGHSVTESATDTASRSTNEELSDKEAETECLLPARPDIVPALHRQVDVDGDVPNNADMFVAFATSEGYFSFRDCKHGSWFIQALCEELLSNAHLDDLDTIMNKVTGRVIKYIAFVKGAFGRRQKSLQTPEISKKGITKKIFFMPKFPPSEVHSD